MTSRSPATTTANLCRNCQLRPAEQATHYRESTVDYATTYMLARGRYRPHAVRKLVMEGTVHLCVQCATRYRRSVALRSLGNRIATPTLVALVVEGVLFAMQSYLFPDAMGGVLGTFVLGVGVITGGVFIMATLLSVVGTMLRGLATRFLRA
jgi:hypothetical protein